MNITTTIGHLTAGNKAAIKAILSQGLTAGKVGITTYYITMEQDIYKVDIYKNDRGMGFIGESLRLSKNTHFFTIQ